MCDGGFGWKGIYEGKMTADRTFLRRCQRAMGGLLALNVALNLQLQQHRLYGVPRAVCAGIEGAVLFAMFLIVGAIVWKRAAVKATHAKTLEAFVWGVGLTMFFAVIWGCMETFAPTTVTHVPLITVPGLTMLLTAAAKVVLLLLRDRDRLL